MSKENPLSHHEQLRYDYLLKNIHYHKHSLSLQKRKDGSSVLNEFLW